MCSIHAEFYLRNLGTQVRDLLVEASRAAEPRQHFLLMRLAPWHCLRGAASGVGCGGPVGYHSLTRLHRGAPALTCSARSSLSRGTFTLSAAGTQYVSLVSDAPWPDRAARHGRSESLAHMPRRGNVLAAGIVRVGFALRFATAVVPLDLMRDVIARLHGLILSASVSH